MDIDSLSAYIQSFGVFSIILGMLMIILQTFFPFAPFILIAGANVLVFGLVQGFIMNYTAACFGALLVFMFARYLGYDWVNKKLVKYQMMRQFNQKMREEGFFYVFLGRLIFVFPSTIVNLGAGVSTISTRAFAAATLLGKFPIILLESIVVHDIQHLHQYMGRLLIVSAIFVLLIIMGNAFRKKSLAKHKEY